MSAKKRTEVTSSLFEAMQSSYKDKYSVEPETAGKQIVVGIPIRPFCLQWLLTSTVLPLNIMIGCAGEKGIGKSSFLYEIMRMVDATGYGTNALINNEPKFSPTLIRQIIGLEGAEKVIYHDVESMKEAQEGVTFFSSLGCNPKKNTSHDVLCIGWDALTSTDTDTAQQKIREEGHAQARGYSEQALSLSKYFRSGKSLINRGPVVLVWVNHLKDKPAESAMSRGGSYTPGGSAQDYFSTFYIWFKCIDSNVTRSSLGPYKDVTGKLIRLKTEKNALGPGRRQIDVNVLHGYDEASDSMHSWFDWDDATAKFLYDNQSVVKDLVEVSVSRNRYKSQRLGLDNVEGFELGRAVHADACLMVELRNVFHISSSKVYTPDTFDEVYGKYSD